MASYIGQVKIDNVDYPVGSLLYGTCTVAASTVQKTVTLDAFDTLADGITIHVKFTNSNTATNPTLKVGSTDAKPIMQNGTTRVGKTVAASWRAGSVVAFTYDGTNWVINTGVDNNTTYSNGTGISIDSSNNINHSNSIEAQSTQGVYPITVDAQGHIASMGSKVTLGDAAEKGVDTTLTVDSTSTNLPTSEAVATLVSNATAGLTGAMHFKGVIASLPEATNATTYSTYDAGDVVLVGDKEYVYDKGSNAAGSSWVLLGDEGSYALKTNTDTVIKTVTFTQNTLPSLTITAKSIPNVTNAGTSTELGTAFTIPNVTDKGSAASFSVSGGTLTLTAGSAPTLGTAFTVPNVITAGTAPTLGTAISVGSASDWNAGSQASLTTTDRSVVVP